MTPDDVQRLLADFQAHRWLPVAVVVLGYLVRLVRCDSRFPINLPPRWQPVVAIVLGQAYAVVVAVTGGMRWPWAIVEGFIVAFTTMGLWDLLVKAIWNGHEPTWMKRAAMASPPRADANCIVKPPTPDA